MDLFTYPTTVEREGRTYYAYSEDFLRSSPHSVNSLFTDFSI